MATKSEAMDLDTMSTHSNEPGVMAFTTIIDGSDLHESLLDSGEDDSPLLMAKAAAMEQQFEQPVETRPTGENATTDDATPVSRRGSAFNVRLGRLLPQEIPKTTLHAVDDLNQMLHKTVEKKIHLYANYEFHGKRVKAELVDLSFPKSYANTLKSDRSLTVAIIKPIFTVIESVTQLVLPEVGITTLHYLIIEEDIFRDISKCTSTSVTIPFSAKSGNEIEQHLPQMIGQLVTHLAPAAIECKPDQGSASLIDVKSKNSQLKKDLKLRVVAGGIPVNLTYNGHTIQKGEKNLSRKRALSNQTDTPSSSSKRAKTADEKKTSKTKKPMKLLSIPRPNKSFFTFDSFEPQLDASTSSFTAYSYWRLDKVHSNWSTGEGTTIAVIDGGIDSSHPAFSAEQIKSFCDFSMNADLNPSALPHGTLCAGIACGNTFKYPVDPQTEGSGVESFPSGVAPGAKLVVCKTIMFGEERTSSNSVLQALQWVCEQSDDLSIDVVSLSLGSLNFNPKIAKAITDLVNKNIIVVCAASNHGYKFSQPICYPARLGHTLCIGSHGHHGKPSAFSPVGQQIDFLAPGEKIMGPSSLFYSHHFQVDSGTSFATPAVGGLICLILSYIKSHCSEEYLQYFKNQWVMKELLREISTSPGRHSDDMGFGALNPLQFFKQPDRVLNSVLTAMANE